MRKNIYVIDAWEMTNPNPCACPEPESELDPEPEPEIKTLTPYHILDRPGDHTQSRLPLDPG